jgi:hypothetical protein
MASLLNWLGKKVDQVVPGNQAYLHDPKAQKQLAQQAQNFVINKATPAVGRVIDQGVNNAIRINPLFNGANQAVQHIVPPKVKQFIPTPSQIVGSTLQGFGQAGVRGANEAMGVPSFKPTTPLEQWLLGKNQVGQLEDKTQDDFGFKTGIKPVDTVAGALLTMADIGAPGLPKASAVGKSVAKGAKAVEKELKASAPLLHSEAGFIPGDLAHRAAERIVKGKSIQAEVSDAKMKFKGKGIARMLNGETVHASDVLKHNELKSDYKHLFDKNDSRSLKFKYDNVEHMDINKNTGLVRVPKNVDLNSSPGRKQMAEEFQHAIDQHEGRVSGTTPRHERLISAPQEYTDASRIVAELKPQVDEMNDLVTTGNMDAAEVEAHPVTQAYNQAEAVRSSLESQLISKGEAQRRYFDNEGEIRGRAVGERANMSQKEIDKNPIDLPKAERATAPQPQFAAHIDDPKAKEVMDAMAKDRADMLKAMHDEAGGVHNVFAEDGSVNGRVSSNDKFYADFYKKNKRPPSNKAWLDEAHRQLAKGTDEEALMYQDALNAPIPSKASPSAKHPTDKELVTLSESDPKMAAKLARERELAGAVPKGPKDDVPRVPKDDTKRGFTKTLESQEDPVHELVAKHIPGYKPITNEKTVSKAAKAIAQDPEATYAQFMIKKQLTTSDDVATGNLLLHKAIEEGDIDSALAVGKKLGVDGTKLGQAVQAYATWKKTTPEGILREATKQAFKAGNELDPAMAKELVAKATRIAEMPEGLEKAKATREMLNEAEKLGHTWVNMAQDIFNMPRALMATADFSAPLRQGAVLGSRFPKEFGASYKEMFKYFGKPAYFEQAMYSITQRPTYALMKSHKLAVDGAQQLTGTEEQFLSSLLEGNAAKKVGIGHVIAASDRAYSGFLTKFRADVFDKVVGDYTAGGAKLSKRELDDLAKFINSASGRGQGTVTDQVSRLQVLFSARLWKSRLDNLNPMYYASLKGPARKLALQSTASFATVTGSLLGLAKLSGLQVETDPRNADFAKIKTGNTRFDILGGHQQNIRLIAQLITGQKVNSVTGEVQTLGPDRGFGKPSRLDLMYQFLENKENPVIGFVTKALRGTDPTGNPINLAAEAGKLAIPLTAQSVYDTAKDTGSLAKGIAMNIPGVFGVGTQTYSKTPAGTPPKTAQKDNRGDIPEVVGGISKDGRNTLMSYNDMSSDDKKKFKSDPKNVFKLESAKFENEVKLGKLNDVEKQTAEKKLTKMSVTKDYSGEVLDFYNLSNADKNAFFKRDPAKAKDLYAQAKDLAAKLEGKGIAFKKVSTSTKAGKTGRKSTGRKVAKGKKAKMPTFATANGFAKTLRNAKVKGPAAPKLPKFAAKKTSSPKIAKAKLPTARNKARA